MAKSRCAQFKKAQSGNIGIVFGLSLVPLLLAGGSAMDYLRAESAHEHLQNALDAGALAVAASLTNENELVRLRHGQDVFASNWKDYSVGVIPATSSFKFINGGVKAIAKAETPVTVMAAFGYGNIALNVESFVKIPEPKKAEIALVLDYSGSMREISGGKVKYIAMKEAAETLVEDLAKNAKGRVKFALVPFSHHVRATLPRAMIAGLTGPGYWTGCTQDRPYPYNLSEAAPGKKDETRWGQPTALTDHLADECTGYGPRGLTVLPLTDDADTVTSQLEAMRPYSYTHIALGVEFGWHVLSPGAPFTEGAAYGGNTNEKYMVVLTDGKQTEPAFGPGGSRTDRDGEKNLVKLCDNAKAQGITIMTISFGIDDDATRSRLQNCATDQSKHYFEAESGADIATAFELIKKQITAQVFIKE